MDVEIHPNAKRHLTEKQVLGAWFAVTECIRRESEDEPPRWLAIGWLPDGRSVELVAVELIRGWLIIHALSPVQRNSGKRSSELGRGVDDEQGVYGCQWSGCNG